jgi:acyl-coenzyme A thioesterase 13
MKPSQELIDLWYTVEDLMPFNSAGIRALTPVDVDEMPQVDQKGRLNVDGWRITWEGRVQPGE